MRLRARLKPAALAAALVFAAYPSWAGEPGERGLGSTALLQQSLLDCRDGFRNFLDRFRQSAPSPESGAERGLSPIEVSRFTNLDSAQASIARDLGLSSGKVRWAATFPLTAWSERAILNFLNDFRPNAGAKGGETQPRYDFLIVQFTTADGIKTTPEIAGRLNILNLVGTKVFFVVIPG